MFFFQECFAGRLLTQQTLFPAGGGDAVGGMGATTAGSGVSSKSSVLSVTE